MSVYEEDIQTAVELLQEFGAVCKYTRPPVAVADPDNPGYVVIDPDEQPQTVDVHMATFSARELGRGTDEWLSTMFHSEVPAGSEVGLIAGTLGFHPNLNDSIVRGGETFVVRQAEVLAPSGVPILYYVVLTR